MSRRANFRIGTLAIHYRPLLTRLAVMLLLMASLWLIVISKNQSNLTRSIRMGLADTIAPVVSVVAKPIDSMVTFKSWLEDMLALKEENTALKAENMRLKQSYSAAIQIKAENERLRALLKFAPLGKEGYISARIAIDQGSSYSRSALIAAGAENGVQEDSAVINDKGMIGRVIEAGNKTARVLLLTDINSRIPVMSEASREHGVAAGNNSDTISLLYLPENSKLKIGEKIVTSGDGALLPPGLPVGIVSKIEKGMATIKPFADWYRLEYISVIDF